MSTDNEHTQMFKEARAKMTEAKDLAKELIKDNVFLAALGNEALELKETETNPHCRDYYTSLAEGTTAGVAANVLKENARRAEERAEEV